MAKKSPLPKWLQRHPADFPEDEYSVVTSIINAAASADLYNFRLSLMRAGLIDRWNA